MTATERKIEFTPSQQNTINGWLNQAAATIDQLYVASGDFTALAAAARRRSIGKSGLPDVGSCEIDRLALAWGRVDEAVRIDGDYKASDAHCHAADAQQIAVKQIVEWGAPAITLIRTFARIDAMFALLR